MRKWLVVVMALVVAAAVGEAGTSRRKVPRGKKREAAQRKRIGDGVRDGSLTKREAARLAREQKRVREMAKDITSDGEVTRREKAALEHAQDKASKHIAHERHDAQGNMGPKPRNWKTWDPGVNQRQRNQHKRVAQGIRSGSLTPAEARQIIQLESEIRKMERAMKSDGVLTKAERAQLHAALGEASKAIFDLKHNDEARPRVRRALCQVIDGDDFTEEDARELFAQCRRLLEIRRALGGPALPPDKRAALEDEFAALAAQLFD